MDVCFYTIDIIENLYLINVLYNIASQMMTFVRLFPFIIGEFVEPSCDHWSCFLILWDICNIVCAYEVSQDDAVQLAWIVEMYLEEFHTLYSEAPITPKMHFLVHLPRQIML